jgi:hypothetical protein
MELQLRGCLHKHIFMDERLSDSEIRHALFAWLRRKHSAQPETKVIEELKVPRPSARVDVAVVNGRLSGFEIKSDRDGLQRLSLQVMAYNRIFDTVSVVVAPAHAASMHTRVPHWWGLVTVARRSGELRFRTKRRALPNPEFSLEALLFALTRTELVWLLTQAGEKARTSQNKAELIGHILSKVAKRKARIWARDALRLHRSEARQAGYASSPDNAPGTSVI